MTGGCHCGAVRYEIDGPVDRFSLCHCDDCRRIGGSAFGAALVLPAAGFRIVQGEAALEPYESSPGKFRCFCRTCGTHIVARMTARPGIAIVRAGTVDGDPGIKPGMHIWVRAHAPWYEICDDLPQFAEGYQPK